MNKKNNVFSDRELLVIQHELAELSRHLIRLQDSFVFPEDNPDHDDRMFSHQEIAYVKENLKQALKNIKKLARCMP